MAPSDRTLELRRRCYEILEHGPAGDRLGHAASRFLMTLIVVNLVAVALQSVPDLSARYGPLFLAIEAVSLVVFTLEYVLRVWAAAEHERYLKLSPGAMRLQFIFSPGGIVDLLAVAPFWIALFFDTDLRVLLVFRMVRFLKLTRYSPGMRSLLDVISAERRALFGTLVIIAGATMVAASIMHLVEGAAQPDKFGTVPDAMWWAIVTLATVGYGDVTPVTALGKLVTSIYILCALIIIALPVGIIATAFANEIHRREFVVTWSMVARVPLFAGLEAADIADVSRLLRSQVVDAGTVIVRRGEIGHSMYFIANGQAEVELPKGKVRLGAGDFFGEMAVLKQARRAATVTAVSRTSLLVLDERDLEALMERERRIAERIQEVMRDRLGGGQGTTAGDMVGGAVGSATIETAAGAGGKGAAKPAKRQRG